MDETPISDKVKHVLNAKQTRDHECHWPGCKTQVKPAMWGCTKHWYKLPSNLRSAIWATYRPGQEEGNADVSPAYLGVADAVQQWIKNHGQG